MFFRKLLLKRKLRKEYRPMDVYTIYGYNNYNELGFTVSSPLFKVVR